MPKLVCVKCEVGLKIEKNGVIVKEMFQNNTRIYKLWETDKWKCPVCGAEIISGFAQYPFAEHFNDDCEAIVSKAIASGKEVVSDKEFRR